MVQCCVDISRGTAFGLCFSQVLFTVACVMFSQKREIVLYTLQSPTNTTDLQTHNYPVHVQGLLTILSVLAFFFAMQTMNNTEHEHASNTEFSLENIELNMMWDMMFWLYSLGAHVLSIGVILNVGDLYLLMFSVIIMHYCLYKACLPKSGVINITQENIYLLGYASGIALVCYNAQNPQLLIWIVLFDYMLGVGHTWDKQVAMDTIINCRLFYTCCQSFLMCIYYTS